MRAAVIALVLAGCSGSAPTVAPDPTPVSTPEVASRVAPDAEAQHRARTAAKDLGGALKTALVAKIGEAGPLEAARFCSLEAPGLHAGAQGEGLTVGRSSLRLRNPKNAAPDWVAEWLAAQGERPAEGVAGIDRVDTVDGVQKARFLAPLAIEGPCLLCHGAVDALAPGVSELLAERYPDDAATGYAAGDLRGALWAEAVVP